MAEKLPDDKPAFYLGKVTFSVHIKPEKVRLIMLTPVSSPLVEAVTISKTRLSCSSNVTLMLAHYRSFERAKYKPTPYVD